MKNQKPTVDGPSTVSSAGVVWIGRAAFSPAASQVIDLAPLFAASTRGYVWKKIFLRAGRRDKL